MKGIIWILVVIVIAIVGYLAYQQGYFSGQTEEDTDAGLELNIGGSSDAQ
jgi:tryptophan-rich sensory protein